MMSTALAFTIVGVAWAAAWVYVRVLDGRKAMAEFGRKLHEVEILAALADTRGQHLAGEVAENAKESADLRARVQELQAALGVRRLK